MCKHDIGGINAMLIARIRRAMDRNYEDGCELSDSELIGQGLRLILEREGVSGHSNAGMLCGAQPEPDGHLRPRPAHLQN